MSVDPSIIANKMQKIDTGLTQKEVNYFDPLQLNGDIRLGDFVFNTIDEDGIVWVIQDIEGWWTPPEPEMPDYSRGNADGSYDTRGRWTARQLTLNGTFLVPDRSFVPLARLRLQNAMNLVYQGTWLRVDESNYNKASWVRLSGKPRIDTVNARGRTEFSIPLKAPDPIKYSWNPFDVDFGFSYAELPALNLSTGAIGNTLVDNLGNIPVACTITISGPLTNSAFLFNSTRGELIRIVVPLGADDILEIDTFDNVVYLNGEFEGARLYIDPLADWIKLSPGFNSIDFYDFGNFDSTANARISFRSGWIG
jgi:hypothetical protein